MNVNFQCEIEFGFGILDYDLRIYANYLTCYYIKLK